MRVFISHSYADRDLARALAERLQDLDHEVVDPFELRLGADLATEVTSAIQRADVVVALLRPTSPNLLYELGVAQGAHRPLIIASSSLDDLPFDAASVPYVHLGNSVEDDAAEIERRITSLAPKSSQRFNFRGGARETLQAIDEDNDFAAAVGPFEFQSLVLEFLRSAGLEVGEGRSDRDVFGLALTRTGSGVPLGQVIIDIKKYRSTSRVPVNAVLRLAGAVTSSGASHGVLISTSGFTTAARGLASTLPISLWTLREILEMPNPRELIRSA